MKNSKFPSIRFKGFTDPWEQRELWQLTIWDKQFNEVDSYKQPKIIKYPYVLADKLSSLEEPNGDVRLLSTGSYIGFTTKEKADSNLCCGEVVAIPWGGVANIKYFKGFFVTADNRIATSNNTEILSNKYLYWWMESNINKIQNTYRGASIKHPSMNDVLSLKISIPSIIEQNTISKYLDCIDSLITLHQRKCEALIRVKKALLEKMFPTEHENTPKIRFKGFTDPWEQRKVQELFKITRGYVLAVSKTADSIDSKNVYPVYSSQTANNGLLGYFDKYLYENAITWTTDGANAGTVNFRAGKFYCTNVCGVLITDKQKASTMFSYALGKVTKQNVSYVGNPKLMNNVMGKIEIKFAINKNEQEKISRLFEALDSLITLHQREFLNFIIQKASA